MLSPDISPDQAAALMPLLADFRAALAFERRIEAIARRVLRAELAKLFPPAGSFEDERKSA